MKKTKICSKCHKRKSITKFSKSKSFKDGYKVWCRQCCKVYAKNYYKTHIKEAREWYYKYSKTKRAKELQKAYVKRNKKRINRKRREYMNNPNHKLTRNMRRRIRLAIHGQVKGGKTSELIGCSIKKLKQHLEKQFRPGMAWNNYGYYGWHIDHIKACVNFDLSRPSEQRKCFHYTNLQPLWRQENMKKRSKNGEW